MIRYRLECDRGDQFEAWFRSSDDYDAQAAAGEIACPECGSISVHKTLMAPSVQTSRRRSKRPAEPPPAPPAAAPEAPTQFVAGADPALSDAIEAIRRITRHVRANAEDVGRRFPEEARKIHYNEAPARNIIGEANAEEAAELAEEGIAFHPLPALPEDMN